MYLHTLVKTPGSKKSKLRFGRGVGSGLGKTAGRGHKGQLARKGHKQKLGFEGGQMRLIRRIPKRGFKSLNPAGLFAVNVGDLEIFDSGSTLTLALLKKSGLVRGPVGGVKVLASGDLTKKLSVQANAFSAQARAKIEGLGGSCEVVKR
jgi:large subunit ribosomal protein L15